MCTSYHLHLLPSLSYDDLNILNLDYNIIVGSYTKVDPIVLDILGSRLIRVNPLDFISPYDVSQESSREYSECLLLASKVEQRYGHIDKLTSLYSTFRRNIDPEKVYSRIVKAIFPSISWTWHAVVSAEIFIVRLSSKFQIQSYSSVPYTSPVDDYCYFSKHQLNPYSFAFVCSLTLSYLSPGVHGIELYQLSPNPTNKILIRTLLDKPYSLIRIFISSLFSSCSLQLFKLLKSQRFGYPSIIAIVASIPWHYSTTITQHVPGFLNIPGRLLCDSSLSHFFSRLFDSKSQRVNHIVANRDDAVLSLLPLSATTKFHLYNRLLHMLLVTKIFMLLVFGTLTYYNSQGFILLFFHPILPNLSI